MRFWTALQEPLYQAALIDDGQIVKTIPERPANTPQRHVMAVGEFDGNLIVGRRCHLELWTPDGAIMVEHIHHPWVHGLHYVGQRADTLVVGCSTLDVVFGLNPSDWEVRWEWWAHENGLSQRPDFVFGPEWGNLQMHRDVPHDTAHLNSVQHETDGSMLVTLLKRNKVARFWPNGGTEVEAVLPQTCPHDFQFDRRRKGIQVPVVGGKGGVHIDGAKHFGFEYVKRIRQVGHDDFLVTHEKDVVHMDREGKIRWRWPIPRPFGVELLEGAD